MNCDFRSDFDYCRIRSKYVNTTFPFDILKQLKDTMTELFIRNVLLTNFQLEHICLFPKLTNFKITFDLTNYVKYLPPMVFPTCLQEMNDLIVGEFIGLNLTIPNQMEKIFTNNIQSLKISFIGK